MNWQNLKGRLRLYASQFDETDLRWSYLIIGAVVLACGVINWFFRAHSGWTIWPFAGCIGIIVLINEAVDRSGEGLPPLQVYAFFIGAVVGFLVVVFALSAVNPLIIFAGLCGLLYYTGRGYIKGRERQRLIASRVAEGLCVHCGEPADYESAGCENCGNDPNPSVTTLRNVQAASFKNRDPARIRAILKPESDSAAAGRKEQALLAKRRAGRPGRR